MLEFIDTILSEPLKDLYNNFKNEGKIWKNINYDVKRYIQDIAKEFDEISLHRENSFFSLSSVFIDVKFLDFIGNIQEEKNQNLQFSKIEGDLYRLQNIHNPEQLNPEKLGDLYRLQKIHNPEQLTEQIHNHKPIYQKIDNLVEREKRIVILGNPGSGKTSILRKLIIDIANGYYVNAIPIFIPLRHSYLNNITLIQYCQKQFEKYNIDNSEILVKRLLEGGKLLILFDGIDEISLIHKQKILDEINEITAQFPQNTYIATSRISNYNGELLKFKEVEICGFDIEESKEYIKKRFTKNIEKSNKLIHIITEYPQIAEIATNPLLLTLICFVYNFDLEISLRRSTLYKRCLECLMRDWDAQRNFRRETKYIKLDELKRISILSSLGFHLHNLGNIFFKINEIKDFLTPTIQNYGLLIDDIQPIIREIIDQYGIINEVSRGVFTFSHLSFQEYFTANYLADNRILLNDKPELISNSFWEEPIILCSSLLPDATNYLDSILKSKTQNQENILIAGLCLSVDPVLDRNLKEEIALKVLDLYHNDNSPQIRERAFYVLGRIDTTFVGNQILNSLGIHTYSHLKINSRKIIKK